MEITILLGKEYFSKILVLSRASNQELGFKFKALHIIHKDVRYFRGEMCQEQCVMCQVYYTITPFYST